MTDKTLTVKNDLKSIMSSEAVETRFKKVLGRNANAFVAAVLNAAVSNPDINQCDPISVVNSALQAAVLDLSISPALGQASIVAFNSKGGKKAQLIVQKGGYIQMALRTNQYRYIHTTPVYEGETLEEDRLTGKVTMGGIKQSPKIIKWAAYFQLLSGFEKFLIMSVDEIMDHAVRYSKSWDKNGQSFYKGSAWDTNFDKMCEKTVLKLLLKNYGVMSSKMQAALEMENETGEVLVNPEITEVEIAEDEPNYSDPDPEPPVTEEAKTQEQILMELGYS